MRPRPSVQPAVATLFALAGIACTLGAQPTGTPPKDRPARHEPGGEVTTPDARNMDLRSSRWFKGRDVVNNANDAVGEVTDLVLDRGSGRVLFVIVDGKASLGNRELVVPAGDFRWEAAEGRLRLTEPAASLATCPTFSEKEWKDLRTSRPPAGWYPDGRVRGTPDATGADPANNPDASPGTGQPARPPEAQRHGEAARLNDWMWSQAAEGEASMSPWDTTTRTTVEGEITRVDRVYSPQTGECVVVEVATPGGGTQKVALGPSWFVNGGEGVPTRGDRITVETVPLVVATDATINGRRLALRDREGRGSWSGPAIRHGGQSYSAPYSRMILASQLRDAKIDCRGTRCGTVNDLVIDARSGSVAFLSIDPDQNFLGIGDTKRLVPWSVASVALDSTVRLDATKEMLLASPATPSTLSELNAADQYDKVYNAYQLVPGRLDTRQGWGEGMNRRPHWENDHPEGDKMDRNPSKDREKDKTPGTTPR